MKETTRLRALATGLRFTITPRAKISVKAAKNQKRGVNIVLFLRVPLVYEARPNAAQLIELLLIVHHLRTACPGDRVILAEKDRLFRADLFAHPAENASGHVDVELLGKLLHLRKTSFRRDLSRLDPDATRRTNEFTKLARHAPLPAVLVGHE